MHKEVITSVNEAFLVDWKKRLLRSPVVARHPRNDNAGNSYQESE